MLEAVLFDLDRTLVDRDGAFDRLVAGFSLEQQERLRRLDDLGRGCRQRVFAAWEQIGGEPMDQDLWSRRLASQMRASSSLRSGLAALGTRFAVGVISNGGGATQRRKMAAAGLQGLFAQSVWISGEVGVEKPDPRLFEVALQALAVPPTRALYVGDLEEVDGVGARAAGLRFLKAEALWSPSGWSRLLAEVAA